MSLGASIDMPARLTRWSGSPVVLVPAQAADMAEVAALEQQAYAHPWKVQDFQASLDSGYVVQLLRTEDGELLGYYVAFRVLDEAHLLNVAVAPANQGCCLGAYLMAHLHQWAVQEGAHTVWLEVRAGNQRAIKLYQGLGYRQQGLRKAYYPAGAGAREDALVLSLRLTPDQKETA